MLRSNLKILSLGLLLASAIGLASCSDVEAKLPTSQQDVAILNASTKITHNDLETLFEALVPGDSSSAEKVLNELLLKVAYGKYGHFFDYQQDGVAHKGLNTVITENGDIPTWLDSEGLTYFSPAKNEGETDAEYNARRTTLVKDFYAHMLEAIQKSFWSNVSNSSYQVRSYFHEKKFAQAQRTSLYAIADTVFSTDKQTLISGSDNYEDVEKYYAAGYLKNYEDYIERNLLPDMYRKYIVEDYLHVNNYSSLGHTYARKIQYIALADISGYSLATQRLVNAYAGRVLEATAEEMTTFAGVSVDEAHVAAFRDFHFLERLYNGTYDQSDATEKAMAEKIYAEAEFAQKTAEDGVTKYYPATKAGAIIKDYDELDSNSRWTSGTSTDFTGGGAYTAATGLQLKLREAGAVNSVTEGWYTSSELSSILTDLKTRLFKIQVANEVDSLDPAAAVSNDTLSYGCYRQGNYYIVPETRQKPVEGEPYRPYLIYDSGSSSWVILRVDEAVKNSKLSKINSGSEENPINYNELAAAGRRVGKPTENQIVLTVGGLLAGSDTYIKAARLKVLQDGSLTYHDQSVYDYFESTFPDLFD